MKNQSLSILCTIAISAWIITACTQDQRQEKGDSQNTTISSDLEAFLAKAPPLVDTGFDIEWYGDIDIENAVAISEEHAKQFLYGKNIQPNLYSMDAQMAIPADVTYYYISKGPLNEQYRSLIFSTMQSKNTITFFCTYDLQGQYIDGIVLQGLVEEINENGTADYYEREGNFKSDNLSSIVISDKIPKVGSPITFYTINENGKIEKKNQA